jgi:hypothetical protein
MNGLLAINLVAADVRRLILFPAKENLSLLTSAATSHFA